MDCGYIKLFRSINEWEWAEDHTMFRLWIYLLTKAAPTETNYKGILLMPGQLISTRKKISIDCAISEQTVRSCLQKLKASQHINQQTTNRFSLITIVNWELYQDDNNVTIEKSTNKQPAKEKKENKEKNQKKQNKEKKKKNLSKESQKEKAEKIELEEVPSLDLLFENFWEVYGIKKGKKKARLKYEIAIKRGASHEEIILGVKAYQAYCIETGKQESFIKHPSTFLHGEHWKDEYNCKENRNQQTHKQHTDLSDITERYVARARDTAIECT